MRRLLYQAIRFYTAPMAKRFRAALQQPQRAQDQLLRDIVSDLRKTEYGQHYNIQSEQDFLSRLPIATYDDLAPWIDQQRNTEKNVITCDKVMFYEKTSGSTGPQKYIPYTRALRSSFSRMFLLWANDLISSIPKLGSGKLYFSISPNFSAKETTELGVPVGMDNDADYLSGPIRILMSPFLHSDPALAGVQCPETFKKQLMISLLGCHDLETISVWNPSFLLVLLEWTEQNIPELLASANKITSEQRDILSSESIDWESLWPNLKLISCWADANAAPMAEKLKTYFPNTCIQGKGLLATEAPMTIPMSGVTGGVPLVTETYFEFLDQEGSIRRLDQLEQGQNYEIIVTQKGGLYRYRMGDEVKVVGKHFNTPTLAFIGRNNRTSDLVGEKLNEAFVREVLDTLPLGKEGFRALAASRDPVDRYILVLDRQPDKGIRINGTLEEKLNAAHHYRQARSLGQLAAATTVVVPEIETILSRHRVSSGKSLGDMKQNYLILTDELPDNFAKLAQKGSELC